MFRDYFYVKFNFQSFFFWLYNRIRLYAFQLLLFIVSWLNLDGIFSQFGDKSLAVLEVFELQPWWKERERERRKNAGEFSSLFYLFPPFTTWQVGGGCREAPLVESFIPLSLSSPLPPTEKIQNPWNQFAGRYRRVPFSFPRPSTMRPPYLARYRLPWVRGGKRSASATGTPWMNGRTNKIIIK